MGSIYRTPGGRRVLQDWCEDRLVGRDRSTVATALGETALVTVGTGARTVLYVPGAPFNAATDLATLDALAAAGFTAVCADLPGQPGLSAEERPAGHAAYADWLGHLVAHVRERHRGALVVAGHGRGAAAVLEAPQQLVDALLLVNPAGLVDVRATWPVLRATAPWPALKTERSAARLARLLAGPVEGYPDHLVPWLALVAKHADTTAQPKRLADAVLHRWRSRPVSVLLGEHECYVPTADLARAAREDLGHEALVVPGAGHLLPEQAPEALVTALEGFLTP